MRIILDLEATCDNKESNVGSSFNQDQSEIIEIGACLVNEQFEIVSEFQTFIKPDVQPVLTEFCTQLTSIRQSQVESAPSFQSAQDAMDAWVDQCREKYGEIKQWGSWGGYDKRQFIRNNTLLGTKPARFLEIEHVNLKELYAKRHAGILSKKRGAGVGLALKQQGMRFEGTHHRAIDDAKNIARLAKIAYGLVPSKLRKDNAPQP